MVKVAQTLKKHEKGILRWFVSKMTNGLLEGINSLVQAAKRKARGYRTTKNYIAIRIYATANRANQIRVEPHKQGQVLVNLQTKLHFTGKGCQVLSLTALR